MEVVQALRPAGSDPGRLRGQERPDLGYVVFADPGRGPLDADHLDGEPGVLELARFDLLEVQVDGHRLGHGRGIGLPDEQAAVEPAAHLDQAVVLKEPDRLAEDGPADAVPGDQLDLAAEQLARLPPLAHNRLLNLVSDYLCLLQGDVSLLTDGTDRGRRRSGPFNRPEPYSNGTGHPANDRSQRNRAGRTGGDAELGEKDQVSCLR